MLNGVYTPELSVSIGKCQQFFHWKTPGAGSEIANSLTVEGNFRVPATRRATNKMADASISDRNLPIKYRTFAMLYRCTDCRLRLYDPIRFYTTKIDRQLFLWRDVDLVSPRRLNEKSLRSSAFYRNPPPGGSRGHQVQTECICTWLSIGLFKDDFSHWNEWEKSTFSAETAGAKAL